MIHFSKYIVVGVYGGYNKKMIVFHKDIQHKTMANLMEQAGFKTLVSGGFINEFMQCYGESMSAGTSSRGKKDTKMLHKMLGIADKKLEFIS